MILNNKTVLFIDLDNTLIKTISGKTFPEDITDFRIQLPVLDKVTDKFPNLKYFFIVTNQGGIGNFITKDEFEIKISSICMFCSNYLRDIYCPRIITDSWEYCYSMDKTNNMRKPNTGMLEHLCAYACVENKAECIMIGDASGKPGDFSDSDKKCAENFGIDYIDVNDFINL